MAAPKDIEGELGADQTVLPLRQPVTDVEIEAGSQTIRC